MIVLRKLFPALPHWTRPEHPVMRYQMGVRAPLSRRGKYLRALGVVAAVAALIGLGVLSATSLGTRDAGSYTVETINNILYTPLVLLQILLSVAALLVTVGTISREQQLQHWDNLRATPAGTELLLRTRWFSVFMRLRLMLTLVMIGRLVLLGFLLYDLTSFQGRYIDLLINGVVPEVSVLVAVLLVALTMTAAVLLPITSIGFDAAVGLLVATSVQQRTYSTIIQLVLIFMRIAIVGGLSLLVTAYLGGATDISEPVAWLGVFGQAAVGDWGLTQLYLGRAGEIWTTVPYSILIGLLLVAFCFVQAWAADMVLNLAVRRAQRRG
jgi:hypothetical protein